MRTRRDLRVTKLQYMSESLSPTVDASTGFYSTNLFSLNVIKTQKLPIKLIKVISRRLQISLWETILLIVAGIGYGLSLYVRLIGNGIWVGLTLTKTHVLCACALHALLGGTRAESILNIYYIYIKIREFGGEGRDVEIQALNYLLVFD